MSDRAHGRSLDWLAGVDDGLVERLQHCTLCGSQTPSRWGICSTACLAIAYVACASCWTRGGERAVERLLEQRYAPGRPGR